ncbi:hypothetical protein SDC9_197152 [bioreactor metagenome]|uniref:Uncharacterized protein n=1 Tax=bioreactor metagenome TaxID=1076179 RepID=A0A645IDX6_9ZZZZ
MLLNGKNCIRSPRIAIKRPAYTPGVYKNGTTGKSHEWLVRMPAEDDIGVGFMGQVAQPLLRGLII